MNNEVVEDQNNNNANNNNRQIENIDLSFMLLIKNPNNEYVLGNEIYNLNNLIFDKNHFP